MTHRKMSFLPRRAGGYNVRLNGTLVGHVERLDHWRPLSWAAFDAHATVGESPVTMERTRWDAGHELAVYYEDRESLIRYYEDLEQPS